MSRRNWWRVAFLGLTAVVLGMEFWAAWDGDEDTDPWTNLITTYIPAEVFALVFTGLVGWIAVHFGVRYWRKAKAKRSQ